MLLIIFHELGHFITAKLFNWKIDKIYIYPLGGVTKFNDDINKPLYEELLVTIMGPIVQIIASLFLVKYDTSVKSFNIFLLHYNLLPIVPLDGSKLLLIFLSYTKPFKKALKRCLEISIIVFFILLLFFAYERIPMLFYIIAISLLFKLKEEISNRKHILNKFLLERYIKKYNYKKTIIISSINNIYKYRNNIIKINNKLYSEKEALKVKML